MVNFFEETEGKRRRTEIIQVQPKTDKKIYEKIVVIGSEKKEPPYEIVQGILSRLPTKAAVRFSCVSKLWLRAVSDTYFRNLHYSRMGPDPKPGILLLRYSKNNEDNVINMYLPSSSSRAGIRVESDIPLYRLNTRQNYELCNACCNGLLCFASSNPGDPIIVCNPLTNEHPTLPTKNPTPLRKFDYFVALGFCPWSKRYKLFRLSVSFSLSLRRHVGLLEVCDVAGCNKPWRTISRRLDYTPSGRPLYLDGKIHWAAIDEPIRNGGNESVILSVDVCSEKYAYLAIPQTSVTYRRYCEATILELEGCLSVAALYYDLVRIYFWVLKDFERGCWDLRYTCEHLPFSVRDVSLRAGEVVGLFSYGNIIYIRLHHRWVFYDTSKDSLKPLLTPLHYNLDESQLPIVPDHGDLTPLHYNLDESQLPIVPDHGDLFGGFYPSLLSPEQLLALPGH